MGATRAPWGLVDAGGILASTGPGDAAAAAIAAGQHGHITSAQLAFVGIGRDAIASRARRGWLHRAHRGVYLLGHPSTPEIGRLAGAILACGPLALLSHRAAAFLWGLLPLLPGPMDVSLPQRHGRNRPGIRVHRAAALGRRDRRRRDGLPVTSPARTLLDLAESEPPAELEAALNAARTARLITQSELGVLLARSVGHRGLAQLAPLFRAQTTNEFSRSRAERIMRRLIERAGLPTPRRNVVVHGHELDLFWPELALNVEVDGYTWHSTRSQLDSDRDRDTFLAAHGIQVIRFTRSQLLEPALVVARLSAAIALAAART